MVTSNDCDAYGCEICNEGGTCHPVIKICLLKSNFTDIDMREVHDEFFSQMWYFVCVKSVFQVF